MYTHLLTRMRMVQVGGPHCEAQQGPDDDRALASAPTEHQLHQHARSNHLHSGFSEGDPVGKARA